MATLNDLKNLLGSKTGFVTLDQQASENQLRVVGRVPPNASSHWVLVVHRLLSVSEAASSPWKVDISRQYFLRAAGNSKKLFYSWRLIFQAPKITEQLQAILNAINTAPKPARVELQEYPLTGASRNHVNGKGAYTAETTPMVAHVASQARMRGIRT